MFKPTEPRRIVFALNFFAFTVLFLCAVGVDAQTWANAYGGAFYDDAFGLTEQNVAGNSYIIGQTSSYGKFSPAPPNTHLVVNNVNGMVVNALTYEGQSWEHDYSIVRLTDYCSPGCVWTTGMYTTSEQDVNARQSFDMVVVRTDIQGYPVWACFFGGEEEDGGTSVINTSDGNILAVGWTVNNDNGIGAADILAVKLTPAGVVLWQRILGRDKDEKPWAVRESADGLSYYIAGQTTSFNNGGPPNEDNQVFVTSIAAGTGIHNWTAIWGGDRNDIGRNLVVDKNGDIAVTGLTHSFGRIEGESFVLKLNAAGGYLWSRLYGVDGYDAGWSIDLRLDEEGYVLGGETNSFDVPGSFENGEALIFTVTDAGVLSWSRIFGGTTYDFGRQVRRSIGSINELCPPGYLLAGGTLSFGAGGGDQYLARTDLDGFAVASEDCGMAVVLNTAIGTSSTFGTLSMSTTNVVFCTTINYTVGTIRTEICVDGPPIMPAARGLDGSPSQGFNSTPATPRDAMPSGSESTPLDQIPNSKKTGFAPVPDSNTKGEDADDSRFASVDDQGRTSGQQANEPSSNEE